MNKLKKILAAALCASVVAASAVMPVSAVEKDGMVYGTMKIPYAEFYAGEGVEGVDAVTSATDAKWKNENLVGGTYNDGNGTILGVIYPVAISSADLAALGENNYDFTETDEVPAAYKEVTVKNGKASFSEAKGESDTIALSIKAFKTEDSHGDYLIEYGDLPDMGTVYGTILHTKEGGEYAMRHLENMWRGIELGWSTGITTVEKHGNHLSYEHYKAMMGQTVDQIIFLTSTGTHTMNTDLYIPVKFEKEVKVENAASGTGKTSLSMSGIPSDYQKSYSVEGLDATVSGSSVSYKNAAPGSYTLTISDKKGKYADVTASFVLSTDEVPVSFKDGKLTAVESAADAANFIKNIATVEVNGTKYNASGKGAVAIVAKDGTVDTSVKSGDNAIFTGNDTVTVTATGYNTPVTFTIGEASEKPAEEVKPSEEKPAGNGPEATASDDVVMAEKPTGTKGTYTVKKGDSLWAIAASELGDGARYKEIVSLNGIQTPGMIQPGTVLVLPE